MRFGLHSGPVTAGVLQGDRARFQLFGDTVNTAARMESNGQRERIQLSSTTAELLAKAGKGHWINPREDKVEAKGKGEMQTYWLENRDTFTQQASTEIDSSCRGDFQEDLCCDDSTIAPEDMGSMEEPEDEALESTDPPTRGMHKQGGEVWATSEVFDTMPPPLKRSRSSDQVARLIDWNVSILQSALKQVIAQRQMNQRSQSSGAVASSFTAPKLTGSAIDEVTEIIALDRPAVIASEPADLLSIYVDEDAVAQLRDYISNIAIMYRYVQRCCEGLRSDSTTTHAFHFFRALSASAETILFTITSTHAMSSSVWYVSRSMHGISSLAFDSGTDAESIHLSLSSTVPGEASETDRLAGSRGLVWNYVGSIDAVCLHILGSHS